MLESEKRRLVDAYRSGYDTLSRLLALKLTTEEVGGPEAHKKRLTKEAIQKVVMILDHFVYLEDTLREENGNVCPHCEGVHEPYANTFSEVLYDFLKECAKESFDCESCFDLGWKHIVPGNCRNRGPSDENYHIERCYQCQQLGKAEFLNRHANDCGCDYYQHNCEHYKNGNPVSQMQHNTSATDRLLKESNEIMDNVKAKEEKFKDVGIRFSAPTDLPIITLPEEMDFNTAIHWLEKNRDELEKEISINHKFPGYYPPDAALALHKAIERTYGFVSQEKRPSGWSIIPPETIGIESSLGHVVQIPWGRMTFHGVKGFVQTGIAFVDEVPVMELRGVIRKGDQDKIVKLVELTKDILLKESIYRSKAIRVDFTNFDPENPTFDPMKAPKFIDLSQVKLDDLILPQNIFEMVDTNLFVPIKKTKQVRKSGIPLRRSVLLAGPFGTGKTLTALVTALLAVNHGWTYIYLDDLKQLPQALKFAKNYSPSVIFGEDIDRVINGERDAKMDEYLNSMDGVDRKHDEVMVVFTTNNVDNIHPAMMRPGRIDAIIPIDPPDATATVKLLYKYGRNLISPTANLTKVSNMLAGQIPAVCREVVERSKLRAVRDTEEENDAVITEAHLEQAAAEMLVHAEYIKEEDVDEQDAMTKLGQAIGSRIAYAITNRDDEMISAADDGFEGIVQEAASAAVTKGNGKHSAT